MYRILYDRLFNCFNKKLRYKNEIVSGLSFYVRIKAFDKNNKELGLCLKNDKEYHNVISAIFYNLHFTIDKTNKLFNINIYNNILLNKNIKYYNISLTHFSIDTFKKYKIHNINVCEPNIVDERTFVNFLIDNHKDFEISDNLNAQNCAYCYEEVNWKEGIVQYE